MSFSGVALRKQEGSCRKSDLKKGRGSIKNNYSREPQGRGNGLGSLINRILLTG